MHLELVKILKDQNGKTDKVGRWAYPGTRIYNLYVINTNLEIIKGRSQRKGYLMPTF